MRPIGSNREVEAQIEWLDDAFTHARVTQKSAAYRWWRRRFVVAEVKRAALPPNSRHSYADWVFVLGGDLVCDHDDALAQAIEDEQGFALYRRRKAEERAKLQNPWRDTETALPDARVVRR